MKKLLNQIFLLFKRKKCIVCGKPINKRFKNEWSVCEDSECKNALPLDDF